MVKPIDAAAGVTQFQSDGALVNCVVLEADEGLVVLDTLLRPADSQEVAAHIIALGKPVVWLVNTHWHSDHCYGNRFLAGANTRILAHADCLRTLERERYVLSPGRRKTVERRHLLPPHLTFRHQVNLQWPLPLALPPTPGHTPDSIAVYLPERRLLIAGDTLLNSADGRLAVPYFYWGDSRDYLASLQNLLTLDIATVIPGHGDACGPEVIGRGIAYLTALRELTDEFFATHSEDWDTYDMERSGILASHCLPGTAEADCWAPQMHGLNLQKLLLERLGKESE